MLDSAPLFPFTHVNKPTETLANPPFPVQLTLHNLFQENDLQMQLLTDQWEQKLAFFLFSPLEQSIIYPAQVTATDSPPKAALHDLTDRMPLPQTISNHSPCVPQTT